MEWRAVSFLVVKIAVSGGPGGLEDSALTRWQSVRGSVMGALNAGPDCNAGSRALSTGSAHPPH